MNTHPTDLEKVEACFLGVQIGDALGMPVETMKHEEIMALNDGRGVIGFMDPVQRKIPEMAVLKAKQATDDWQLTQVVFESLIACDDFSVEDCAERHVNALEVSTFGWGKTTQRSIEEIRDKKRDPVLTIPTFGNGKSGSGNGIIMKVSPLAIVAARNHLRNKKNHTESIEWLSKSCMNLCFITHPDPRAGYAAFAVALVIYQSILNRGSIAGMEASGLTPFVISKVKELERTHAGLRYNPDTVSGRLERILSVYKDPDLMREATGCGFTAMDTAAFTIGTFFRHPRDFKKGLLEAVNAGGDTDTNASIVGAMIGANVGIAGIPVEWVNDIGSQRALSMAKHLWEVE
jgi:ADP-ribosylglycohydrolase